MNCPHCGADTKNAVTICPLCAKTLDRENAFLSYVKKGDDAYAAAEFDKAVMSYKKALEYSAGNEEIFLKLGNAYDKKGDKQAAAMYIKALGYNFYNDKVHNLLIALYSKYGKLNDLKKWYAASREKADPAFIDKYIKIIQGVSFFSASKEVRVPAPKKTGIGRTMMSSMKRYIIMNIVVGIFVLIVSLALAAGYFFRVNTSFLVIFSGVFMAVGIVIVVMTRSGKVKKKETGKQSLENLMAEEIAKAKAGQGSKSQNGTDGAPPVL